MCNSTEYQYNNAYSWRRYFDAGAVTVPARRGSPGTFYASDRLRRWDLYADAERPTPAPLHCARPGAVAEPVASPVRHLWILRHLRCNCNFRRISHLLAVDFAAAPGSGCPDPQRNGSQHRFRIFKRSARSAFLPAAGQSPRSHSTTARRLRRWRGIGVIAFLHQLHRSALWLSSRGSAFSGRARIASSVAAPGSRLRFPFWNGYTVGITRRPNSAAIVAPRRSPASQNQLPVVLRREAFGIGVNCNSAGYVQTKNQAAPEWSSTVQEPVAVRFLMLTIFSTDMESLSVVDIFLTWGLKRALQLTPAIFCPSRARRQGLSTVTPRSPALPDSASSASR